VLKDREPSKPFQLRGEAIHKAIEIFLQTGEVLPTVSLPDPLNPGQMVEHTTFEFVQVALPYLPKPATHEFWKQFPKDSSGQPSAMLLLEQDGSLGPDFTWEGGPSVVQYIDNVAALPKTCKIQDYKTTSDFRYAKTPEELQKNTQLCWNAKYIFSISDYDEIEVEHLYLLTKSKPKAKPVTTKVTRAQVEEVWARDLALMREMAAWAEMAPSTADPLPPNTESCDMYGGCFYRKKCGFDVSTIGFKPRIDPMSEPQKNNLLAEIINAAKKAAPDAPIVQQATQALRGGQAALDALLGKPAKPLFEGPAPEPEPTAAPATSVAAAPEPEPAPSSAAEALRAKLSEHRNGTSAPVPTGITPPDAPPATSTPDEVAAANADKAPEKTEGEEPAAAEAATPGEAAEAPKKRGRPPKKAAAPAEPAAAGAAAGAVEKAVTPEEAAAAVAKAPFEAQAPAPGLDPSLTNAEAKPTPLPPADVANNVEVLRQILETPDPAFDCGCEVLFIDCLPTKGWGKDQPAEFAGMIHGFERVAAQSAGAADYRFIDYKAKGYLAQAVRVLMRGLPKSVYVDSKIPGADVFVSVVTPYCQMIFRGAR
jgi:hypothetical protein